MPQPPAYNRTKDFTENFGTETDHASVNAELDKVSNSINDVRANLAILQADDGKLRPEVVTPESVAPALFSLIVDEVKADAVQLLADANTASANAITQAETATAAAASATASKNAAATSEANASTYAAQAQAAIGQPADGSVTDAKVAASLWGGLNKVVSSIAALKSLSKNRYSKALVYGYYSEGDGGGGAYYLDAADTTSVDNGGTVIVAADGGRWKLIHNGRVSVAQFGAQPGEDLRVPLQAAVDASPGTYDLDSAYEYAPSWEIHIPDGEFSWSSGRVTIAKNNIRIIGAGQFNTVIKCPDTMQISEMIRFKGAYACELSHLTIDGGLPFSPTGSETYGADIGLVLDQVAHFRSIDLNICNTRYEGKRCIHLWESYFENLRLFNLGFFGNGSTNRSAGIRFTLLGKEETKFAGGESNNITYNKVSFGTVGSYVSADEVPAYNVTFRDVIAEGRTWPAQYPSSAEVKWRIGGTSNNIVIDGGYSFPHAQSYNASATLFDFTNVGPGCRVRNYRVYMEKDSTHQEVSTIISCDSYSLIELDVDVEEIGSSGVTLINSSSISTVTGSWAYRTDGSRTRASLFGGGSESRFVGSLYMRDSGGISRYEYQPKTMVLGNIGSDATMRQVFQCVAWANYNGSTNTLNGAGNLTVAKNSTGVYTFTFSSPMPDAAYAVNVSSNILNSASEKPEIDNQTVNGFTVANRAGATYYDPSIVNVTVFR